LKIIAFIFICVLFFITFFFYFDNRIASRSGDLDELNVDRPRRTW
jgi:hypothetical protein